MERYEYGYLYLVGVHVPKKRRQPASDQSWACAVTGDGVTTWQCESAITALNSLGHLGWMVDRGTENATPGWVSAAIVSEVGEVVIASRSAHHFMRLRKDETSQ